MINVGIIGCGFVGGALKDKKFAAMTPLEAELTKYMHNVFGAYKVTYLMLVANIASRWVQIGVRYIPVRSSNTCMN